MHALGGNVTAVMAVTIYGVVARGDGDKPMNTGCERVCVSLAMLLVL